MTFRVRFACVVVLVVSVVSVLGIGSVFVLFAMMNILYSCIHAIKGRFNVRTKPFRSERRTYTPRKTFCKRFFSKKRKKFLREISRKTFTFGTLHAYTVIPPFNIDIISSYSSLFRLFTGCKSISPNVTPPEQSDILTHKLLFSKSLFMF